MPWIRHHNWIIIMFWKIWCCKSIFLFGDLHFMKWYINFQWVEVRLEEFVLVGDFLQEIFALNHLPFLKWEINYQMAHTHYHLFTSLWYSSPHLFALSISLCPSLLQLYLHLIGITSPILVAIVLSLYQSTSNFNNFLLLVMITFPPLAAIVGAILLFSSPTCDILLLVSLPCQYHFAYPCYNCIFASTISLRLYLL